MPTRLALSRLNYSTAGKRSRDIIIMRKDNSLKHKHSSLVHISTALLAFPSNHPRFAEFRVLLNDNPESAMISFRNQGLGWLVPSRALTLKIDKGGRYLGVWDETKVEGIEGADLDDGSGAINASW